MQVFPSSTLTVKDGDYMGFLNEGDSTVISYDFAPAKDGSPHSRMLVYSLPKGELPSVGQTYTLNTEHDTYLFGMSVVIDTGKC